MKDESPRVNREGANAQSDPARNRENLMEVLGWMREKPGLYLCARTIDCLRAFIYGWLAGAGYPPGETELLMVGFQEWVKERFHVEAAMSWNKIILFHSMDNFDALDQFFALFEEYNAGRTPL